MSYEPRGKVRPLLDAMRASDRPVWTSLELAQVLECTPAAVPAYVDRAIQHGLLYRRLESGRTQYSLKPFPPAATAATDALRESTATGWRPPQMACTRPGAEQPRAPSPAPTPAAPLAIQPSELRDLPVNLVSELSGAARKSAQVQASHETAGEPENSRPAEKVQAEQELRDTAGKAGAPPQEDSNAPQAAPVLADASIPEAAGAEDEQEPEPVTWNIWEDGDLDLHGLIELEGGGHRLPAEALRRLRKFIAWMPA